MTKAKNGNSPAGDQSPEAMANFENDSATASGEAIQSEAIPPTPPAEPSPFAMQFDALQRDLTDACAKRDEYLDGWQRSQAEFVNYKRRVDRDREQMQQTLTGSIVKRYFEIGDDLERALKKRPEDGEGAAWAVGIDLIYRKLLAALEAEGVKPMQAVGQFFDPTRHEAIGQDEAEGFESGQVIEVIQNGYVIGDRVLRPALVRIAR